MQGQAEISQKAKEARLKHMLDKIYLQSVENAFCEESTQEAAIFEEWLIVEERSNQKDGKE